MPLKAVQLLALGLALTALAGLWHAPASASEPEGGAQAYAAYQMEPLSGASSYMTRAQQLVRELAADGTTDINELVSAIVADNSEVLDHIVINLATQTIYECNFSGEVLNSSRISSGRKGYDTPVGEYRVVNHAPKAYSEKYEAWMLHWMGLTSDGSYGMHGLEGSSYERLLGGVASHGCIRLSREYAKDLYSRVKVGLPVTIVNEKDLKLTQYEPMSRRAVQSMVLEVLSPADPWEVFY